MARGEVGPAANRDARGSVGRRPGGQADSHRGQVRTADRPGAEKSVLESSRLTLEQTILISFSAKLVAEAKKQLPKPKPFWLTGFGKDKKIGAGAPRLRTCSPPSRRFRRTAWTVRPSLAPLTAPSCRSFEPGGWNCTSRLSTTSRPPCIPGNSGPIRSPRTAPLAVGTDGQTANPPPRAQPPAEPTSNVLSVRNLAEIS